MKMDAFKNEGIGNTPAGKRGNPGLATNGGTYPGVNLKINAPSRAFCAII